MKHLKSLVMHYKKSRGGGADIYENILLKKKLKDYVSGIGQNIIMLK